MNALLQDSTETNDGSKQRGEPPLSTSFGTIRFSPLGVTMRTMLTSALIGCVSALAVALLLLVTPVGATLSRTDLIIICLAVGYFAPDLIRFIKKRRVS